MEIQDQDVVPPHSPRTSVVMYRFGGREYPQKTVPGCLTCHSDFRMEIEEAIVLGRTYQRIIDSLPEGHGVSVDSVIRHSRKGHMPLDLSINRQIVEARAQVVGKRIEEGIEDLVDGISLAQTVVHKTFEAIVRGEIKPEIRDGLRAAKLLSDFGEYDGAGFDQQAINEAFMVYHDQAQMTMTPEQFEEFGRALNANPVLKALAARHNGQEPEVVRGEAEDITEKS